MLRTLYRSTPFRLVALLSIAFVVFLALAGSAAFALIRSELNLRMRQQLEQSFSVIAQSYGQNDLTDLTDLVRSNAAAYSSLERVFLLRDPSGQILAGNITIAPEASGWASVASEALGIPTAGGRYQTYGGAVGGNTLVVGASVGGTEEIGSIVLSSLGLAGGLFIILAGAAGGLIARSGQRRMERIAATMALVGRGELAARIPVVGTRDDLDDLAAQINLALDRLSGLVESMRQVSVDIAHDLKTPLNRLSFTVQSAIETDEAGEPLADLLLQAQDEARQINATFEALLRIAQIEAGARRARFKPVNVGPILQNLFEVYEEVVEENGQNLLIDTKPLPEIHGDRDLLTQLFANLIENAMQHCPAGATIALTAQTLPDHSLEVSVLDNGPGIPETERDKVFQRLYRLDKSRNTQGSGLGLSLVKAIGDLHGATVSLADNHPGLRVRVIFSRTGALAPIVEHSSTASGGPNDSEYPNE